MVPRTQTTTPLAFAWLWGLATLIAAMALICEYGFHEPRLPGTPIRFLLIAAAAVFLVSRLALLFPASELAGRLRRWWVDYILILAGALWWAIEPVREPVILRVAAMYILTMGAGAAGVGMLSALFDRILAGRSEWLTWRIAGSLALAALLGGMLLSLPICWAAPVTGQKTAQYAMHLLNCCFTAASAVTCTGLTPLDIGQEFTPAGQIGILVLLQAGGLGTLVLGTALGMRLRQMQEGNQDRSQTSRVVRWAVGLMVVAELVGAAALYSLWDLGRDSLETSNWPGPSIAGIESSRVLLSVFHAVSAFCNGGFSLCRDGLAGYAWQWQLYGAILPLMILGSIGGPALHELWNRRRRGERPRLSRQTAITLGGTIALLVGGAALLWGIENTHWLQLRYPRQNTPGKLLTEENFFAGTLPSDTTQRIPQRLRELPAGRSLAISLFESTAARTGGFRMVRLDESSITPASRWLLILLMLVGGGVGGTAGGIRICTAWTGARAVFRQPRETASSTAALRVIGGMLLLVGATCLVLLYRDVGSFEASLFEAVSACCNVGLTTGLTRQLYVEAKIALVLAMLLGRAIPLGMLVYAGTSISLASSGNAHSA